MAHSRTLVILVMTVASHLAVAANEYPFAETDDYLAPATAFDGWANTLSRHRDQNAALYLCPENRKACRGRLGSFNKAMKKAEGLSAEEQIELVHFYINRSEYDEDRLKRLYNDHGKRVGVIRNHWATLHEFLVNDGDCEDYATAKYFMLRELGFKADDMRVVVVYERKYRGHHAVLAVRRENGTVLLLDSDNFIRRNGHYGYRYVYAMNEHSIWDHREDFEP